MVKYIAKRRRREVAKLLKHTGLSLPIRYRLAKFHVNGKASGHTFLPNLLDHLGLKTIEPCVNNAVIYSDGKKGRLILRYDQLYFEIDEGYRRKRALS